MWQCQYNKFVKLIIHSDDGDGDNVVFIATIFHNYCIRSLVCVHLFVCLFAVSSVALSHFRFHCYALKCAINSLLCRYSLSACTSMYIFHIAKQVKVLHRHSCTMHVYINRLASNECPLHEICKSVYIFPILFCRQNESWISVQFSVCMRWHHIVE